MQEFDCLCYEYLLRLIDIIFWLYILDIGEWQAKVVFLFISYMMEEVIIVYFVFFFKRSCLVGEVFWFYYVIFYDWLQVIWGWLQWYVIQMDMSILVFIYFFVEEVVWVNEWWQELGLSCLFDFE